MENDFLARKVADEIAKAPKPITKQEVGMLDLHQIKTFVPIHDDLGNLDPLLPLPLAPGIPAH